MRGYVGSVFVTHHEFDGGKGYSEGTYTAFSDADRQAQYFARKRGETCIVFDQFGNRREPICEWSRHADH